MENINSSTNRASNINTVRGMYVHYKGEYRIKKFDLDKPRVNFMEESGQQIDLFHKCDAAHNFSRGCMDFR